VLDKIVIDRDLSNEIRKRFSPLPENEMEKVIDGIQKLISYGNKRGSSFQSIMDQAARTIYRHFEFKEIAIIIKSKKDGLFRYSTLLGFRRAAEMANRSLVFTEEGVENIDNFPHIKMGKMSEFHMAEHVHVEGEDIAKQYNRPSVLTKKRESPEEYLEGDYIDIDIRGTNEQLLGWIELGQTKDGKMPSRSHILWIELIANFLGMIIQRKFDSN